MNDRDALLAERDTLAAALRELNNQAIAARSHVEAAVEHYTDLLLDDKRADANDVLVALDSAVADAGELLARVRS